MAQNGGLDQRVRFGVFEADLRLGELRKHGLKIKLQEKPFQVLAVLLEHPGQLVTREGFRARLWPADTFVDFDHGLNAAVGKVREALGDCAGNPRFVETLSRRGYRFIAPVCRIEDAGASARTTASQSPHGPLASLAVLPLQNATADPGMVYLAEAISEAILYGLAQVPGLRVIAHSTASRYRGRKVDPRNAGREMGVGAVLIGKVAQNGEDLDASVELVDVSNGWHLWGQRYTLKVSLIAAFPSRIVADICEKLRLPLTGEEKRLLARRFTENNEAYHAYLKGLHYGGEKTDEGLKKGIECFQRAVESDPDYALAYAGLAECYNLLAMYALLPPRELIPRTREAATRALALDDRLAEAHTSLAVAGLFYDWDWIGAEGQFSRALELNSNCASAHYWYGLALEAESRSEEALAHIQRAWELDPASPTANIALGLHDYFGRRYEKAIEKYREMLVAAPRFYLARCFLGLAYEQMGKIGEAIREFQTALCLSAWAPLPAAGLAHTLAIAGRQTEALELLKSLDEKSKRLYVSPVRMAIAYAGLRQNDTAFAYLEKAYTERSNWLLFLTVDPLFDSLRLDPRFDELRSRIGLPPGEHGFGEAPTDD